MAKKKRDNFSAATVRALRESVSNLCSHPECRALTIGPNEDKGKPTIVGTAAHITAASYGGPRFDPSLTQDQRKSYENGIWLCNNHARQIDVDPDKYPTELLHKWKEDAEQHALKNIGYKLIPEKEVNQKAVDYAFQMVTSSSSHLEPQDMIKRKDKELEKLDPRFNVSSIYSEDSQLTKVVAKEQPVPLNLKVHKSANERIMKLFDSGEVIHIESDEFVLSGSPLLEKLLNNELAGKGRLTISPHQERVDLRISVVGQEKEVFLGEFHGNKVSGQRFITVEASLFKNFLKMSYKIDTKGNQHESSLRFSFLNWDGIQLCKLPYFSRIFKVIPALKSGGRLNFQVSFNGDDFIDLGRTANQPNENDFYSSLVFEFEKIHIFRSLDKSLGLSLNYKFHEHSDEELEHLHLINDLLDGPLITKPISSESSKSTVNLVVSEEFSYSPNIFNSSSNSIVLSERNQRVTSIMDQNVVLPKTKLEIVDCDSELIKQEGNSCTVEVTLRNNGYYRWSLQDELS